MLDIIEKNPFKIQYPETSIQHHSLRTWNHVFLKKSAINFQILIYLAI